MGTEGRNYPVGFWNYNRIEDQDESAVRDWADAGMTLAMGPDFGVAPEHVARMLRILDAAHERGLRVILCHEQGYWKHLTQNGEEAYRRDFAAAFKIFGGHPAVWGFHVGDEPRAEDFADACAAARIQKELAPPLRPFLNLFPWHPGVEGVVGHADWAGYLDEYAERAGVDLLCYDCYSQMNPLDDGRGWDMYFRNLLEFEAASKRHDIPWWTTLLSVGHFRYRCPTEDDFRWQMNTALAHGARGLLWFFLYMRAPHDNYRVPPIDEHGERTETFERLSRVCRSFQKSTAGVMSALALKRVSHVGRAWGGAPAFDGTGRVSRVTSGHKTDLIVSEFTGSARSDYVMIVNNSQTESTQADMWIRGCRPMLHRVGWRAVESPVVRGDGWTAARGEDFIRVRPWLAPGQAELYRVE